MNGKHYIVIAESKIGIHSNNGLSKDGHTMYALTFPVIIGKFGEEYASMTTLKSNSTFKEIVKQYKTFPAEKCFILLSHDLDENGELMAEALKDNLCDAGVNPLHIFRTPLTEKGYIGVRQFVSSPSFKAFLYHQQEIMKRLKNAGLPTMGISKILALKYLSKNQEPKFKIGVLAKGALTGADPRGTSTATAIQQYLKMNKD